MNYKRKEALFESWIHAMLYFKNVQSPNDVIISHQANITTRGKYEILK